MYGGYYPPVYQQGGYDPRQSCGPPQGFQAYPPPQGYQGYPEPQQNYGPPQAQGGYQQPYPQSNYSPQGGFQPPYSQPSYGPPQGGYQSPNPSSNYGPPSGGFQQGFLPQNNQASQGYQPTQSYDSSQQGLKQGYPTPQPQQQQQQPPQQQGYGPPGGVYGQPAAGYGQPQQGYNAPQGAYTPPNGFHGDIGSRNGQKKALICGCNYPGTQFQLKGCINDTACIAYLLQHKFGFERQNMRILTDESQNPADVPTRANMIAGFQWLVSGCQPGDSLFFHYSGHGSQCPDPTGDEDDGMNETLCPTDFKQAGMIVDDEVNARLINPLPHGVILHIVIDACHSGSVCDMEYSATVSKGQPHWANEYSHRPSVYKGTNGGRAIQFGAATDDQTAADTNKLSGNVSTGAATFSFIQAIESRGTDISYGDLLHEMHRSLKHLNGHSGSSFGGLMGGTSGGGGQSSIGKLFSAGVTFLNQKGDLSGLLGGLVNSHNSGSWKKQTPTLCCNEAFDFNMPVRI